MNPEISVIIPCYNCEASIAHTIESILIQKFQKFEIIAVNDGSTDRTADVLSTLYAENPKIKILHQENGGVSKSRNLGLKIAQGKYIVFIDSDDWIGPNFLSEYVRILESCDEALIFQGFISEYETENIIENLPQMVFVNEEIAEAVCILEEKRCLGGIWNKIFIKEVLVRNKIFFNEHLSYGEDKIFTLQYLKHISRVYFSEQCEYYYNRKIPDSLSKKHHKSSELLIFVEEEIKLFRELEKRFPNKVLRSIFNARFSSFAKYVLLSMYRKNDGALKKDKIELRNKIIIFDKQNERNKNFEIEVPKIINFIYASDFLMFNIMRLKEKFIKMYQNLT